jgi:hemolysin III
MYIAFGWAVVIVAPQLVSRLSTLSLVLVIAGGLLYTGGAIVLARKHPDPAPATFGYHEVWHSMVVAASACHYAAVLVILIPARAAIG